VGKRYRILIILIVGIAAMAVLFWGRSERAGQTQAEVTRGLPRLVDLGSKQCIPCKKMAPILEELAVSHARRFEVSFIDVREEPQAATDYGIRLIPTQIFYDGAGRELFRHEGFFGKEDILAKWRELGVETGGEAGTETGDEAARATGSGG